MPSKPPRMKLSRDEERFLRHWMYKTRSITTTAPDRPRGFKFSTGPSRRIWRALIAAAMPNAEDVGRGRQRASTNSATRLRPSSEETLQRRSRNTRSPGQSETTGGRGKVLQGGKTGGKPVLQRFTPGSHTSEEKGDWLQALHHAGWPRQHVWVAAATRGRRKTSRAPCSSPCVPLPVPAQTTGNRKRGHSTFAEFSYQK